jgi:hypothetical protein
MSFRNKLAAMSQNHSLNLRLHRLSAHWVLVPVLLTASPALAEGNQARERAARKACLAGDAAKGVEILADLFVDTRNPTYIFNQGRCFEQNRQYKDAAARFEEYLRTPSSKLTDEDRATARKHIAECKEKIEAERAESPYQPPPQMVAPVPVSVPEPPPSSVATVEAKPAVPSGRGEHRRALLTAGIVTGAVGLGGIVTGVIFNMKANSAINDMEHQLGAYSESSVNDQRKYKTLAWDGYGVGAACAVAGGVLIGLGVTRSGPKPSDQVAVAPSILPGQVGAVLTGGF